MNISDTEKAALNEFVSSALYRRAKEQVLESAQIHVIGSDRNPDNIALDLATKEGMAKAFKELEGLPAIAIKRSAPITPTLLSKKTQPNK